MKKEASNKLKEKYGKVRTLGSGQFGTAILSKGEISNEYVVIKNIDISCMDKDE